MPFRQSKDHKTLARRKRPKLVQLLLVVGLQVTACAPATTPEIRISGVAMGTFYSVSIAAPPEAIDIRTLKADIDALLDEIEQDVSTYRPDSVLSRFNSTQSTDWFSVTPRLCAAVEQALALAALTDGAFDPTVGPLVNLWGFGPDGHRESAPDAENIEALRDAVGYRHLTTHCDENRIRKSEPDVYVDLSGFAKGLGVDEVVALLDKRALASFLVEIGGDLFARGLKPGRQPWRVAIEKPVDDARVIQEIVPLTDAGMATSGDYRNFFVNDSRRYSHIIDPRSAYPVTHDTASVTVYAANASRADALATALLVLGTNDGARIANELEIGAYFLSRSNDSFDAVRTATFPSTTEVASPE